MTSSRMYAQTVRLDHLVIAVSDAGRSNAFYRDVVGSRWFADISSASAST
jgi:catechol-2,3-dioxygenase